MPEEREILLSVDCPGCKVKHEIAVRRNWLKTELETGRGVRLYCIRSDASWNMSDPEKRNMRKAFADGIL